MSSPAKYSDLRSQASSKTVSLDGETEYLEDVAFLDGHHERPLIRHSSRQALTSWGYRVALMFPWLLVVGLSAAMLRGHFSHRRTCRETNIDRYCAYRSLPSYHDVVFKRDFGPEPKYFSEYTGWPSDELDARWDALYEHGIVAVDASRHDRLFTKSVKTPVEGYENTYMVSLDVFHNLHCLNVIRKSFYPRRYNMSLFREDDTVDYDKWIHVDHCIDTIRQSLMCNADTSAQGFDWFPELEYLRVRLDTVHRCRNWDRIHDWADKHWAPWSGNMAHVDEKTGRVIDHGRDPNDLVRSFVPDGFRYTKEDM